MRVFGRFNVTELLQGKLALRQVFRGLFWPMFLSLWLTNAAIIAATVFFVSVSNEAERFRENVVLVGRGHAVRLIAMYEHRGFVSLNGPAKPWQFKGKGDDDDKKPFRPPPVMMEVYDLTGKRPVLALPGKFRPQAPPASIYEVTSDIGRIYRVTIFSQRPFSLSGSSKALEKLLSLQLVIVFVVSAIAAWLMTLMIVRPVNRLKSLVVAIRQGELETRPDRGLSQRHDEFGDLAREFHLMSEFLDRHINSQTALMQDISHELRAPLARLQAAAGLAQQRWGEEKVLVRMMSECDRLSHLIAEMMNLSKLESQALSPEPVPVQPMLEGLASDIKFSYPRRVVNVCLPAVTLEPVKTTPALLERAIMNALVNACKYTDTSLPIDMSVYAEGGRLVFEVRDFGEGVSDEVLASLTKPFYRVDPKGEGYGLGLSIAQRAMTRLNGEMSIKNHEQRGLVVTFKIPY
ncbi:MAG: HAMP domain-containing sensor histidine kinase [Pontibacterium sp.]